MNAKAKNELSRIKQELRSIIFELENTAQGIPCDFEGIGNNVCSDRLRIVLNERLYKGQSSLNAIDPSKVTQQFADAHGGYRL